MHIRRGLTFLENNARGRTTCDPCVGLGVGVMLPKFRLNILTKRPQRFSNEAWGENTAFSMISPGDKLWQLKLKYKLCGKAVGKPHSTFSPFATSSVRVLHTFSDKREGRQLPLCWTGHRAIGGQRLEQSFSHNGREYRVFNKVSWVQILAPCDLRLFS